MGRVTHHVRVDGVRSSMDVITSDVEERSQARSSVVRHPCEAVRPCPADEPEQHGLRLVLRVVGEQNRNRPTP